MNTRSRLNRQSPRKRRVLKHLRRWRIYIAGILIVSVFIYIVALGTIQFARQLFSMTAYAPTIARAETKELAPPIVTDRAIKLEKYLIERNSPLAPFAEVIVSEADKNDIPYTLVAAISGKESSFGKAIKPNSHNAWGVMAWDNAGTRYIRSFGTWTEGIEFVSNLLGENYRANMYKGIQQKYCPSYECSSTWVENVTSFSEEINK